MLTNENFYCIIHIVVYNNKLLERMMLLEKIREIRKIQGLTQQELAKMSKLSRSSIINFEADKRNPKVRDLQKIANALNVPIEELIN